MLKNLDNFSIASDGILEVLELQMEGKKRMTTDAFLRGYTIEEGMTFKRG